jgi:diadenosine tetraphosphate (Ap4A) HIT family hydrolase
VTDHHIETAIHRYVARARAGDLARVIGRTRSGWAVMGDPQILPGYCLLYPDPVVTDLHALRGEDRRQFLADMGAVGEALMTVTRARRINYEMLGNVEPALHAHIVPRYEDEAEPMRHQPVWLHEWGAAPPFDPVRDAPLMTGLRAALGQLGVLV